MWKPVFSVGDVDNYKWPHEYYYDDNTWPVNIFRNGTIMGMSTQTFQINSNTDNRIIIHGLDFFPQCVKYTVIRRHGMWGEGGDSK